MRKQSPAALITVGVVLSIFALLGLTNSEHTSAKIVYAILLPAAIGLAVLGFYKRRRTMPSPKIAPTVTTPPTDKRALP